MRSPNENSRDRVRKCGPQEAWKALLPLLPKFAGFLLSFLFIAVFWINRHRFFSLVRKVDWGLPWLIFLLVPIFYAIPNFLKGPPSLFLNLFPFLLLIFPIYTSSFKKQVLIIMSGRPANATRQFLKKGSRLATVALKSGADRYSWDRPRRPNSPGRFYR